MDDANKQSCSFGSGQQRNPHPRPFFYVQPPSQPYYLYQPWQLNNPYSHYGLSGGFNFGRPCVHPFQYMQYPGFVFPHAPVYPMDYRRMFEPRFHAPPWGDMPRQQQHHDSQPPGRREMACSEAQTDPSDAITQLIECLDKIRASELQAAERELDSGVASQSSGMFSPVEEKKNEEQQSHVLPLAPHDAQFEPPAVTFGGSTAATYDGEPGQRSLSPQGCWSGGLEEEELPLDTSSIHEECPQLEESVEEDEHFLPPVIEEVAGIQSDVSVSDLSVPEELVKSLKEAKSSERVSRPEHLEGSLDEAKVEQSYKILKLPFDGVLTSAGAGRLPSPATPYYYNYLSMQPTHERMSVLSPSLDELSSRDEMFSTDLDDVDLFPQHLYPSRRLAEVIGGSPPAAEEVEEVWRPGSKSLICACCGKNLSKGTSRSKVHSSKVYRDDAGDSEDEDRYGRGCEQPVRVVVKKHLTPRKTRPLPQRHPVKHWYKRGQYKEAADPVELDDSRDVCKQEAAEGGAADVDDDELQCRTCQDRFCREEEGSSRWTDSDVIPRRRPAAPLQRQEMTQWKPMYHRPRDDDRDEDDELHWERDMEAATLQHSFGMGPHGPNPPHGAQQPQGPQQPAPGPSGAQRPEEQHHKPFFFIQPSQPYLPMQSLQWPVPVPMPVSYNPYYGYPGLGYGMPVMPHYQSNPYMEPPGFVVPHTRLHLMDYRRMLNPQYYQTMAYHSRRFRYQQNSQTKETTTSEVQTEPLTTTQRTSTPTSTETSTLQTVCRSESTPSVPTSQLLSPALTVQKGDPSPELKDMVPSSTTRTPSKGSFMIQTEEVRIECCTTPVGLQLLHAHETAGMSHSFSQDVVQCSSFHQKQVLQEEALHLSADQSEQALQGCPDILLVGTPSTGEKSPTPEASRNQMHPMTADFNLEPQEAACDEAVETRSVKDLGVTSKNFHFDAVDLPFDQKYLDELRKMESTVWSMEETLIPSPEPLIQNGPIESHDDTLIAVAESTTTEVLMFRDPTEELVSVIERPPLAEDELEDMVPSVEVLSEDMVSEGDLCTLIDVPVSEDTRMTEVTHTAEVALEPKLLLLDNPPLEADRSKDRETNIQSHQDTSFESLPAYLPSTSWIADFDNVHYYRKMPLTPKKQTRRLSNRSVDVPTRRRKLDMDYKEQPNPRKPKERYKGKVDRQSLSDHECCQSRGFNENMFSSYVSKRERLCSRCLSKCRICTPDRPGLDGRRLKRKAFQQCNDGPLPTCEACKSHTKRQLMRKSSNPDFRGRHDTEGESSENSSGRTGSNWRAAADPKKLPDLKRPLASKQNQEKCPAAVQPKLREKNYMCNELQRQPVVWERSYHCSHGSTITEMDENCAIPVSHQDKWRDQIDLTHRSHTEKSWKDLMPNADNEGSKREARSQHLNKHKKSQPQSQGIRRKDARW